MNTRRRKHISAAYRYSFSGLVLNYYLYYENLWESSDVSDEEKKNGQEFGRILEEFLDGKDALEDLDKLRDQIIGKIELLTGFSDCFQIYEYVLNRIERRFLPMKDSQYTPKSLAMELVDSIGEELSGPRQNERLQNIVAQLPVRLTRQKFYSMVIERLSVYAGSDKVSIEKFMDMLRTSSMVKLPEHMEREKELYEILETLKHTDYRSIEKERYMQCNDGLSHGSRILMDHIDSLIMLINLVNDLYVLFLTRKEAVIDAVEDQAFKKAVSRILNALRNNDGSLMEEGDTMLSQMEGIQESVEHIVMGGNEEGDEILEKVDKLVSGSHFAPLEETEVSGEMADKAWIEIKAKEFCNDLDRLFEELPKAVVRGVMAKVLSSLPIIFRDSREVEEYILSCLESCSDHSEREACMELLEQELME